MMVVRKLLLLAFIATSLSGCVLFYFPPSLQGDDSPKVGDAVSAAPGEAIFHNISYQEGSRSISVYSAEGDYAESWQSIGSPAQFLTIQDIDLKFSDGSTGKRRIVRLRATAQNPGVEGATPSFTGVKVTSSEASYSTRILYQPEKTGDRAGILAWRDHQHYVFCGASQIDGKPAAILLTRASGGEPSDGVVRETRPLTAASFKDLGFRIDIQNGVASCFFIDRKNGLTLVGQSRDVVGNAGTLVGAHAYRVSTAEQ